MSFSKTELKILNTAAKLLERHAKKQAKENEEPFTSPATVRKVLQYRVAVLEHEVFGVIHLNHQYGLIKIQELFRGTVAGAAVYPREVVKSALTENSSAVIFFHNHPSGSVEPSQADIQITERLKTALSVVDIQVLDHFIVTANVVVSFNERGLL